MSKSSVNSKKKLNLKEKLNDDTLDLSLCDLDSVPVKEILEFPKVKKLNLSYNKLTCLQEDFVKLQHIREIDLSKNHLKSLPKNIGALNNLKNLDLLGNELTSLPSSFCELKSLQWLDLKDNPLAPELKKAAGDCLDEAQCKKCAVNIIKFVKAQAADEERKRQAELRKNREEQLKKEAEEREKANQLKLQKKLEREQRRQINEQRRAERMVDNQNHVDEQNNYHSNSNHSKRNKNSNRGCCKKVFGSALSIFFLVVFLVGCLILMASYCDSNKKEFNSKYGFLNNQHLNSTLQFIDKNVCPLIVVINKNLPMEKVDNLLQSLEIFDLLNSLFNFV